MGSPIHLGMIVANWKHPREKFKDLIHPEQYHKIIDSKVCYSEGFQSKRRMAFLCPFLFCCSSSLHITYIEITATQQRTRFLHNAITPLKSNAIHNWLFGESKPNIQDWVLCRRVAYMVVGLSVWNGVSIKGWTESKRSRKTHVDAVNLNGAFSARNLASCGDGRENHIFRSVEASGERVWAI